ncbi:MAG: hypothetical protein HOL48_08935 [Porticoccaceae bacterium]|nr:hypothetical protein [Porticoccaceae bacterium]
MIFRRFTRKRPIATSLMAGGTLVVMAVVGWGVPTGDVLNAAWLSFLMVLLLALPAALLVLIIVLVQRFRARQSENEEGE